MKFAYFPGCSLHSTAKEYDASTKFVCGRLGIELVEIPNWVCCGATPIHRTNALASIALPAKNLLWAQTENLPVAAPCSECFSRLKLANLEVAENEELKKNVSEVLGETYEGNVDIYHLPQVIIEKIGLKEIEKKVAKKLSGLKIASYYGCLLTRPPKVATFDRIEDPQFLDNLVLSLGAESVNWAYKTECCGATFSLSKKELVLKLTNDILQNAYDEKADCIMVACPLCHSNLDLRQKEVEKKYKVKYNLPVFYFTQLIGLSMGADIRGLGLKRHMVSAEKLLSSKGLI